MSDSERDVLLLRIFVLIILALFAMFPDKIPGRMKALKMTTVAKRAVYGMTFLIIFLGTLFQYRKYIPS